MWRTLYQVNGQSGPRAQQAGATVWAAFVCFQNDERTCRALQQLTSSPLARRTSNYIAGSWFAWTLEEQL